MIEKGLAQAASKNMGVIAKRPIANAPWRFDEKPLGHYSETYWERFKKMNIKAEGLELNELALRFTAFLEGVSSCIVGTSNIEHLKNNIKLIEKGKLPQNIIDDVRNAFRINDENWVGQV